jgi:hypothetical protein
MKGLQPETAVNNTGRAAARLRLTAPTRQADPPALDYRRSLTSHLFYSKRRPSFRWFRHQVNERFGADVAIEQYRMGPEQPASDQVNP